MTAAVDQALAAAQDDLRIADRHADAGDESAVVRAAVVFQERQRIRGEAATTMLKSYGPDHDLGLQRAQCTEHHRQDVADRAREAARQARQSADVAHRRFAGPAADPLYTALARAGLHILTDRDHRAIRDLTRHPMAGISLSSSWSEMKRGTFWGYLGASPAPIRVWPGTSAYCQTAVSRKNWESPEIRWIRDITPSGLPVRSAGAWAMWPIQSRQCSRVTSAKVVISGWFSPSHTPNTRTASSSLSTVDGASVSSRAASHFWATASMHSGSSIGGLP
ncbi:hypothetical protein [Kitasatospora sp. NPDC087315]|uniref:hypothetical protein n=1 Tax=Kitasatospora sp. NPDC087315 TaxID=3364069 RepID=UPI0038069699